MTSEVGSLFLYSGAITIGAVAFGALPLLTELRHRRMDLLLALSAGVMLGAAFFHMLPEAVHEGGLRAVPLVLVGFLAMFTLERYALVHACEEPDGGCEVHGSMGLAAFLGLSLHTLFDGLALGSSLAAGVGGLVFIAVIAHKIPSSLALTAILVHEHYRARSVLLMLLLFALMVPLGAGAYLGIRHLVEVEHLTAYALAFSAGTFLYLSLADLLPQVHRRSGTRLTTVLSLLAGVCVMYALSHLGHGH